MIVTRRSAGRAGCSVCKVNYEQAERFIATREIVHPIHRRKKTSLSAWGRNQHFRNARAIFNAAVKWGYIQRNPFAGMAQAKPDHQPWHFITPDEFKALLAIVPDIRTKALYSVMYGTGLRYGEAINLLWDGRNIDFERGKINITNRPPKENLPSFLIKDHEVRSAPMPQWVIDKLTELQAEAPEGCPFVFLSLERWERVQEKWFIMYHGGSEKKWQNRYLVNGVLNRFKKQCRLAGIQSRDTLNLHCLRKSYAQNLADAGTPSPTLKKLMGHASIRTTEEYYLKSTDANEERACQSLDRIMSGEQSDVKMTFKEENT